MKKTGFLIHGEKGGVGKSFCAKVLLDVLIESNPQLIDKIGLLDCDTRNPDVAFLYEDKIETGRFDLTVEDGWNAMVDWIEKVECPIIIISLPAQVGVKADELGGIFAEAMDMIDLSLNLVWMLDSGLDSVKLFDHCRQQGWPVKRTFVVKNTFLGRVFDMWDGSKIKESYMADSPWGDLELPALDISIRDALVKNRLTFVEGFMEPESPFNSFQRIRLKNYFEKAKGHLKPVFTAIVEDLQ